MCSEFTLPITEIMYWFSSVVQLVKGFRPAFADLLAEQVLWQARAPALRKASGGGASRTQV